MVETTHPYLSIIKMRLICKMNFFLSIKRVLFDTYYAWVNLENKVKEGRYKRILIYISICKKTSRTGKSIKNRSCDLLRR